MHDLLTDQQQTRYAEFKQFVSLHVTPFADAWDRDQQIPRSVIGQLGRAGYLGCGVPPEFGGQRLGTVTFGLLNEACGRGSASLTSVFTVQAMVATAISKWGSADQKNKWLPLMASGEVVGAFALTEPGAGSATESLVTELTRSSDGGSFVLNGTKKWITCAQIAGVYLVFAKLEQQPVACLVPRESPGVRVEPIGDLLGFRAAALAEVHFEGVNLGSADIVGKPGFGLSHVAQVGLQYGRISTACSGLGVLRGCFEESVAYANERSVGNRSVGDFGMIRSLLARMGTDLDAGGRLCHAACRAADEHVPDAFEKALAAKYFTSTAAVRAASNAVQIHGAAGCHGSSPVARYYRDAKIMEIIEGTTQVHEDMLARLFLQRTAETA